VAVRIARRIECVRWKIVCEFRRVVRERVGRKIPCGGAIQRDASVVQIDGGSALRNGTQVVSSSLRQVQVTFPDHGRGSVGRPPDELPVILPREPDSLAEYDLRIDPNGIRRLSWNR